MWDETVVKILPYLKGFTLWEVNERREYEKIDPTDIKSISENVCYLAISCAKERELLPYNTGGPIEELLDSLSGVVGNDIFRQINRGGPFFGEYLRIEKA
ncbi:hypothetical protein ACJJI4_03665 [Microbulbifer sp. TRSA002]|uniref:hypothetical protein n=1 Tax=Microbulbifer sp. TRSA002 TaxID=3243382 RepID=UPI004039D9DD